MVAIAMMLALFFVIAFVWASLNGQWDDLETPAHRILLEDIENNNPSKKGENK
jgi:cbb3-type cytochrome oxidase maturation protein